MKKEILVASLLLASVLVGGCIQQAPLEEGEAVGDVEASAYSQIEQEMEQAIEDLDLEDLEDELLI
jgi:outer membrane murein-binding lipoprotein Lpp